MSPVIIYNSRHGHTKHVVDYLGFLAHDVKNGQIPLGDFVIVLCPTYGDEELPLAMEEYLLGLSITGKRYALCELGNYYGYEDCQFGAAKIIRYCLSRLEWVEPFRPLSLDSLPVIDWDSLKEWKDGLCEFLQRERLLSG